MFKVFVSYSTDDLKNVTALQKVLEPTGVQVFVAEHSVLPSEPLAARISAAIAGCDMFVVLWSANAKASEWVSQEIGKAHSLGKPILPLLLTEGLSLPGFISDLKYLPLYGDSTAAFDQARDMILKNYRQKMAAVARQKEKEKLVLLGIGAFLLWAANQNKN